MTKKNKGGFTLIEIVVTMSILTIVVLVCGSLLQVSIHKFIQDGETTNERLMVEGIENTVLNKVRYSTNVVLGEKVAGYHNIYFENGHLMIDGVDVFDDTYYLDNSIDGSFSKKSSNILGFDLVVTNKNDKTTRKDWAVNLVNMELNNSSIVNSSGNIISYKE
ncbi:MAG: prepilin-type N-terminal cleavage/methylation domain-containing protein [Erysipelotrichaceae bacterium]